MISMAQGSMKEQHTGSLVELRTPKILAYDIECTGLLGYTYGTYETSVHKIIEQPILLSFSYAWYEPGKTPKIICRTLADTDTYDLDPKNDRLLVRELWELFNECDVTLGHNSKAFDDKMTVMFFLKHRFNPTPPRKQLDTKVMAQSIGRFPSKSLNNLSDFFGIGQKTTTTHADLWWDSVNGGDAGRKAMKKMATYNNMDVKLTIKLYEILRPYFKNHLNLARLSNEQMACGRCLSKNTRIKSYRRDRTTNVSRYRQYYCENCKGYFSDRKAISEKDGDVKPAYVNV